MALKNDAVDPDFALRYGTVLSDPDSTFFVEYDMVYNRKIEKLAVSVFAVPGKNLDKI